MPKNAERGFPIWSRRALGSRGGGGVVLAYHLVGAGTSSPVDIPLVSFRQQMALLQERFEVVSLSEALRRKWEPRDGARPLAIVTFDDAYLNFHQVVWPLLAERRMPAMLYVPVGFVCGTSPPPIRGAILPACSWADLRALVKEGLEVGSHSWSHANLRRLPPDAVERELVDSRKKLEQELGVPITSFCYPQAKWNRALARRVSFHYESAVVAGGRRARASTDLRSIPRYPVKRSSTFTTMIRSSLWLPEAVADRIRQWRS